MSKRIKILAISYLFPNKVMPNHGIFVLNRLKALNHYVDIKVINPIPWFPFQRMMMRYKNYREIPHMEIIDGLEVYHPRFFSIPRYFKYFESLWYLRSINSILNKSRNNIEFDLVDMHWTFPDLPAGLEIAEKYQVNSLVTLRGMEAFHFQDNDKRKDIVAAGLRFVDGIISLSNEMKRVADGITGQPDKSIVIRNGVDTDQFFYIDKKESRSHIDMNQEEVSILSVGSLIYRKGFDLIINSLHQLNQDDKYKGINLYIIGSEGAEGDYRKELYKLIHDKRLTSQVKFVGQVANDELKYWYNACDLFCLSSRGEGSPNVLTEALACGCPAVTTDVGSAKEIIESEKSLGTYVSPDNESELLLAIKSVLDEKVDRELNAHSLSKYNWNWCAQTIVPIYKKLR